MVDINDYREEKSCVYEDEHYLVRDNGAVLRMPKEGKRTRKLDNQWTFGKVCARGYLEISSVRVHRIVATAFCGEAPTPKHVVDHIDTNRQNNKPSNLRWLTRLENAVVNEATRKKIEYITGVSVFEFLENPKKYRDAFDEGNLSWMRTVTEEEAKACLENFKKWSATASNSQRNGNKVGEWIYKSRTQKQWQMWRGNKALPGLVSTSGFSASLSSLAKQKGWQNQVEFPCCPERVGGAPMENYQKNLFENAVFARSHYGDSTVVKFTCVGNEEIVVITAIPNGIKPYALAKVTFKNGFYLHESMGTFFNADGAEKQYMIAQGLEWTGGDSIDDYC